MNVDTAPANASRDRAQVGVRARPTTCRERLLTNSSRDCGRKLLSWASSWDPRLNQRRPLIVPSPRSSVPYPYYRRKERNLTAPLEESRVAATLSPYPAA